MTSTQPPSPLPDDLEQQLGVELPDRELTRQALTHTSYLNENPGAAPASNERLEFLGDAILGAVVADYLYRTFPDLSEGELTELRAAVVRGRSLAEWARRLRLGGHLLLGKGEEAHGGRDREGILSSAFEALIAAVYLQLGYNGARKVLELFLPAAIESVMWRHGALDAKSKLQHLFQATRQITPVYRVADRSGPAHKPTYTVDVFANGVRIGRGVGRGKRSAEQAAAIDALSRYSDLGNSGEQKSLRGS